MSLVTPDLLRRYDVPGPRYTSYPTADRFVEAFRADDYIVALKQRKVLSATAVQPLSLYVHVPFCESLCYYCACNKIITKHHERAAIYLEYLERELDLHVQHLGRGQVVSQLHFGGGSPTFLSDEELARLMHTLRQRFELLASERYSRIAERFDEQQQRLDGLRAGFEIAEKQQHHGDAGGDPAGYEGYAEQRR